MTNRRSCKSNFISPVITRDIYPCLNTHSNLFKFFMALNPSGLSCLSLFGNQSLYCVYFVYKLRRFGLHWHRCLLLHYITLYTDMNRAWQKQITSFWFCSEIIGTCIYFRKSIYLDQLVSFLARSKHWLMSVYLYIYLSIKRLNKFKLLFKSLSFHINIYLTIFRIH